MSASCGCKSDIYLPEPATICRSEQMTEMERLFEIKMDSGKDLGHMPGQFVEVSLPGIGEAPISVSSSPTKKGSFELVVRNMGDVTGAMHGLDAGAKIGIRGPFGTTFPVDSEMKGKDLLFVCGGLGLVPVRSAIDYVLANRGDYGTIAILVGCKSPAERLCTSVLGEWEAVDKVTVTETVDVGDDGWTGNTGVITTLMPGLEIDPSRTVAIVCGPPVMYKFVLLELDKMKLDYGNVYVSLERHMKCGVGKCGHCQVGNLYVCQDGPVFKYSDIEGLGEAIS